MRQPPKATQGIAFGIVLYAGLRPRRELGGIVLLDGREQTFQEERVDVGPHVLVAERNPAGYRASVWAARKTFHSSWRKRRNLSRLGIMSASGHVSNVASLVRLSSRYSTRKSGSRTLRECSDNSTFSRSTGFLMSFGTMLKHCISTNSLVSRSVN